MYASLQMEQAVSNVFPCYGMLWGEVGNSPCATAGGIRVEVVKDALEGRRRYPRGRPRYHGEQGHRDATDEFPGQLNREEIDQFRVMTDF